MRPFTCMLEQLERSGQVSRSRDAAEARATPAATHRGGRRTISRFLASRRKWLTSLLAGWSEPEQASSPAPLCASWGKLDD